MKSHALLTSALFLVACFEDPGQGDETDSTDTVTDAETGDATTGDGESSGTDTTDNDGDTTDETTGETGDGDPAWPEPYAFWLFDGDLLDSVGDAHGTDPTAGVSFLELDGRDGATFGETGYMLVGNIAQDLLGWEEFSIAIRYYAWTNDDHATYLSVGAPGPEDLATNSFGVRHRFGLVEVQSESGDGFGQHYEAVGSVPSINAWHTLVWTFEKGQDIEGTVRYYEDGVLISDISYILPISTTEATVIGGWYGTLSFQGVIDQLAVYDYLLEPVEVSSL